jgi:hypothetical protein
MKMKIVIAAVILFTASVGAQADDNKTTKKAAAPAPHALTIPKDAVPNPDGVSYIWTDKQGKKWVYAKTPFGIDRSPASDAAVSVPSATKVIDKGDTVRFERPSPFGTESWEKKKSELTNEEQHLFDAQHPDTQHADAQNAKTEQKND